MAMGGIHGGNGYTFQDRYIVCHIPKWLADPTFVHIMPEATGDVDIVYNNNGQHSYDHIQIKDHAVTNIILKEAIKIFSKINDGTKDVYNKFTLTAPSVNTQVKSLITALERFREAKKLYAQENANALSTTNDALFEILRKLKLETYNDFIISKVYFEIGLFDFSDNSICKKMFSSNLLELPTYKEYLQHLIFPVYSSMIDQVLAHRGVVLPSAKLYSVINEALSNSNKKSLSIVLHAHNWTVEKYEPEATLTIDWSQHFDRQTRKVPDSNVWNNELIPQLNSTKQDLAKSTTNRHIVFRGKCTLSTGIALGMTFPEVGDWTFELSQPPQIEPWRSDAGRIRSYKIKHRVIDPKTLELNKHENEIAFIFNITGKAFDDVVSYLKQSEIALKKIIVIQPSTSPGNLSIKDASEAVSLASAAKDIIKMMVTKYKSNKTHLFYFGPIGLSIFLGQKLTSVGNIQLYEFQEPSYKPSCLLKS